MGDGEGCTWLGEDIVVVWLELLWKLLNIFAILESILHIGYVVPLLWKALSEQQNCSTASKSTYLMMLQLE
jgi:hypothetical protein